MRMRGSGGDDVVVVVVLVLLLCNIMTDGTITLDIIISIYSLIYFVSITPYVHDVMSISYVMDVIMLLLCIGLMK